MQILFTPAAIGYLTEFILASVITLYLVTRLRHAAFATQTRLLVCFFAATTFLIFLLLCDVALVPSQRLYALFLENVTVGLILCLILQFAYHFPQPDPRKKWESRLSLVLAMIYALWEAQFAIFRFTQLSDGHVYYRPPGVDVYITYGFAWLLIVFIRQTIFADERQVFWIRKLLSPRGQAAQATRTFALTYLFILGLALMNEARTRSEIPTSIYQLGMSIGLMLALFGFALTFLNFLPERTSFRIKLAGATLALLLMVFSGVGWVMAPNLAGAYPSPIPNSQTIHFVPNDKNGYDAITIPFYFDADLGHDADLPRTGSVDKVAVNFNSVFFGQPSQTVYISDIGAVSIGREFENTDVQYYYGTSPTIFLLNTHLLPETGGGVWVKNRDDRLTVTWLKAPFFFDRHLTITLQLILERSGNFTITYADVPSKLSFDPDQNPFENVWLTGAVPGDFTHPPTQVHLSALPWQSDGTGLVQDYYLDFRQHLNHLLEPLAILIVFSSLLIIAGIPFLINANVVVPLNRLIEGMRQANQENRVLNIPIQSNDEIGFLTAKMMEITAQRSNLIASLEARAADRTQELSSLFEVLTLATYEQSLPALLDKSLAWTLKAMGAEAGVVLFVPENEKEAEAIPLRLVASRGFPTHLPVAQEMQTSSQGMFALVRTSRQPVIIPNLAVESNMPAAMRALESRALLVAPLQAGSQLLGVLGILRHATREFSSRDLALIAVIANQLGIAIQSQSLREQAEQIVLLKERQRLARDLHDSVTQSLYSVTLFAQAIRSATYTGNLPLTQQYVNRLSEMAQQALKEMRWLIYELRPALIEEVGLVNALQRRLELVERRAGVAVQFESKTMQELDAALENSIYQIAQESLNNTLKHAGATFITVRMSMDARHFRLEIQDDGKGFDLAAVKETAGLGLASMQERTAQLGGTLTITTKPGHGTRIQLSVPHSKEPSP